ncbi:MAG TPA: 16S rRNA (guanine(527)-N(7))-methyltransferase RsmG [Microbacteriaceae bacterium]|nr:16S rRNA (guanine(527)-N(7))-methyltransferase RsmG [Microbacteriaceae bacterium]
MIEVEPLAALQLAQDQIEKLRLFTNDIAERGEELGLIGPKEAARIWTRHVLNSAIVAPLLSAGTKVVDIGTGGGMPGLVLAIVRPDVNFKLVEPMERRCAWLNEQIATLKLENVDVLRGRAEEFHGAFEADVVTARAVSALRKLIPLTAPLLNNGGELILLKGDAVEAEIEAAQKQIKKFKLKDVRSEILGVGVLDETTRVFRATVERVK